MLRDVHPRTWAVACGERRINANEYRRAAPERLAPGAHDDGGASLESSERSVYLDLFEGRPRGAPPRRPTSRASPTSSAPIQGPGNRCWTRDLEPIFGLIRGQPQAGQGDSPRTRCSPTSPPPRRWSSRPTHETRFPTGYRAMTGPTAGSSPSPAPAPGAAASQTSFRRSTTSRAGQAARDLEPRRPRLQPRQGQLDSARLRKADEKEHCSPRLAVPGRESVTLDLLPLIPTMTARGGWRRRCISPPPVRGGQALVDFFRRFLDEVARESSDLSRYHFRVCTEYCSRSCAAAVAHRRRPSPVAPARASVTYDMMIEVLAEDPAARLLRYAGAQRPAARLPAGSACSSATTARTSPTASPDLAPGRRPPRRSQAPRSSAGWGSCWSRRSSSCFDTTSCSAPPRSIPRPATVETFVEYAMAQFGRRSPASRRRAAVSSRRGLPGRRRTWRGAGVNVDKVYLRIYLRRCSSIFRGWFTFQEKSE